MGCGGVSFTKKVVYSERVCEAQGVMEKPNSVEWSN